MTIGPSGADPGPVLPKWLLAKALRRLRTDADLTVAEVADKVRRDKTAVSRWEKGLTLPDELAIEKLGEIYDALERIEELKNLRSLASKPGWWSGSGPRPPATAALLGMEIAAIRMRSFDHSAIPGLLQTPGCARAIIEAVELDASRQQVAKDVQLRMDRQARVFTDKPPEATFIIDENALRRLPGRPEHRRAQLGKLLNTPLNTTVQVLPFSAGPHPAMAGFVLFDFDSPEIERAVYSEWSATLNPSVAEGRDIAPYEQMWERVRAIALPRRQSARFLRDMMEGISDEED